MQRLQEISAKDEKIARLQASVSAKKAAVMAAGIDPSTSIPNLKLNVKLPPVFDQYVQPFAPTSASQTAKPWSMPKYMTPPQTPLLETMYRQTIEDTVPTSASQIRLQQLFETPQFKDFANIKASGSYLYLDSQTSATTL